MTLASAPTRWSPQQSAAIDAVGRWLRRGDPQVFRLFGYAGTGKSTLARHLAAGVDGEVMFGAFTGKAALVMRKMGCDNASTLHSMIYHAVQDERGHVRFEVNRDAPVAYASLIVVDEVSMVGAELGQDLLSFDKPVLVLGDPAQLPPVDRGPDGGGFFTSAKPDVMLTEIHRQARDNPIIDLATRVRTGERLVPGEFGRSRVITRDQLEPAAVTGAGQVLVGRNKTRQAFNLRMRELLGFKGDVPRVGEKLVCLKNNHPKMLLNGGIWRVAWVENVRQDEVTLLIDSEDFDGLERKEVTVPRKFFTGGHEDLDWRYLRRMDQMTYGYTLTVHKSQGSQWDDVLVFDESAAFGEDRARWLYTAITRAAERVTVVLSMRSRRASISTG